MFRKHFSFIVFVLLRSKGVNDVMFLGLLVDCTY